MRSAIRRILLDVGRPGQPLADALQLHRIVTAGDRVLPDFLVIGVQRGGTTSLYNYLSEHLLVRPAYRKEVHFFDYNFDKGVRWYRSHFPRRNEMEPGEDGSARYITGESSPYYIFHPLAAQRVRATIPDVRLIALLRNPVDRAISHYNLSKRNGFEKLSLAAALEREAAALSAGGADEPTDGFDSRHLRESYLRRGIYADQLDRWLALFPDGRLLILRSEDLFSDPAAIAARAQEFLGLPAHPLENAKRFNEGDTTGSVDPGIRRWLADFYRPHNKRLEELLAVDFAWD